MSSRQGLSPLKRLALGCLLASLGVWGLCCPEAPAQQPPPPPLRLAGLSPGGVRSSVTESWGLLDFQVTNLGDVDRAARVVVFDPTQPDVRYGRDVWVPARSMLSSWLLIGPSRSGSGDLQFDLYDRSDGKDHRIEPRTEEHIRSRLVVYQKRQPSTTILVDEGPVQGAVQGQLPQPQSAEDEVFTLARAFHASQALSERLFRATAGSLPAMPEAFDGIDHFIVASSKLADDPAGLVALRRWVQRGGKAWVMLDLVDPEAVAPLLGDAVDFQVVDRVPLTRFEVTSHLESRPTVSLRQEHERPVDFVRVLLPAHERPRQTIDGWPAWFVRPLGRGKVVFTTLGPRGWHRPRNAQDQRSPFEHFPDMPVGLDSLHVLGNELLLPAADSFQVEDFRPSLTSDIGYSIVSRELATLIFAAFLLATVVLVVLLRRSRRPELVGWLAPAAALLAAGVFVGLGERSRRAVPATVAVGQIVDAGHDGRDVSVRGLVEIYRPGSGPAPLAGEQGGIVELDTTGLTGQARRLIWTDLDAWHMENLSLPAGVRQGPFRCSVGLVEPVGAVIRFGPAGIEGKLRTGPFREVGDALLHMPTGRNLAVRLREGTFSAGPGDVLPPGQFLAGTLLSDQQKQRQEVYREFLKRSISSRQARQEPVLLAWARPIDTHFTLAEGPLVRTTGDALLVVPLRMERPPAGTQVTIPGPLCPFRRVLDNVTVPPTLEQSQAVEMHLRFQLPRVLLPLRVERVSVSARINAPARQVAIAGLADGKAVEVHRVTNPLDPIRVDISDKRLLHLSEEGGLDLVVSLGERLKGAGGESETWKIHYLEVTVTGVVGK